MQRSYRVHHARRAYEQNKLKFFLIFGKIKRRSVLALMMAVAETSEKSAICTRRSISEDTFKQNINSSLDENYLSDSIFPQVFKNITKYEYRLHETPFSSRSLNIKLLPRMKSEMQNRCTLARVFLNKAKHRTKYVRNRTSFAN